MRLISPSRRALAPFASLLLVTLTARAPADVPARPGEPLPPFAATAAVLYVEPQSLPGGPPEDQAAIDRRLNTHVATLRNEQHLRTLLLDPQSETRKTAWFKAGADPVERIAWLRDHLRVAAVPGTPLIELTLPDVADLGDRRAILTDVCGAYLVRARKAAADQLADRISLTTSAKIKTEMRLRDLQSEMREKTVRLSMDGGGVGRIGVKEMELAELVKQQIAAQVEFTRREIERNALRQPLPPGQTAGPVDAAVDVEVDRDARVVQLARMIDDAALRAGLAKAKNGDKDPVAAAAEGEIAVLGKHLAARRAAVGSRMKAAMLAEADARYQAAATLLEQYNNKVNNLKNDLGELSAAMASYYTLQDEQKSLLHQLKDVRRQIEEQMTLASNAGIAGIRWHLMPER